MNQIHNKSIEHVNGNLTVAIDHQSWVFSIWYNEFLNNRQTDIVFPTAILLDLKIRLQSLKRNEKNVPDLTDTKSHSIITKAD